MAALETMHAAISSQEEGSADRTLLRVRFLEAYTTCPTSDGVGSVEFFMD